MDRFYDIKLNLNISVLKISEERSSDLKNIRQNLFLCLQLNEKSFSWTNGIITCYYLNSHLGKH